MANYPFLKALEGNKQENLQNTLKITDFKMSVLFGKYVRNKSSDHYEICMSNCTPWEGVLVLLRLRDIKSRWPFEETRVDLVIILIHSSSVEYAKYILL